MSVKREQVREHFPHGTAVADEFKRAFGRVILRYIKEGEKEIGRPGAQRGIKASEIELRGFVQKKGRNKNE